MIRSAETVKEALQAIADHLELHTAGVSAYLIEEEDRTVFCYEVRKQARGTEVLDQSEVQVIELGLAMSCYELRAILGNDWRPQYVQFRHAAPYNLEPLQQVFGEHISFNQDRNAIHLTSKDSNQPLAKSRPAYRQILQREIQSRLGDTIPVALKTDRTIRLLIDESGCSIEKVAATLGVSSRTLQLRLKEEGKPISNSMTRPAWRSPSSIWKTPICPLPRLRSAYNFPTPGPSPASSNSKWAALREIC